MAIRNTQMGGTDFQDTGSDTLNGSISDSDTTITVNSTVGFKSSGTIRIDNELIDYSGTTATTFTGCTRGQYGTTAASHTSTTVVYEREVLKAVDLNDTFDEIYEQSIGNVWFLNSNSYDVYDDFEAESVGAFTTNSNWTISGTAQIVSSTEAGGTGKELRLGSNSPGTHYAETILLSDDTHKFIRVGYDGSTGGGSASSSMSVSVSLGGSSGVLLSAVGQDNMAVTGGTSMVLVVALGNNQYDVYAGGKKVISSVTAADPQIRITISYSGVGNSDVYYVFIDDIRESKFIVS